MMRCPICKKPIEVAGNPHRPFCSERCRMLDLESWLSERYRIASPETAERPETEDREDSTALEARLD